MKPAEHEMRIIKEFQDRLREFRPIWNRNILFIFLPGFLMFGAAGPGYLLIPGAQPVHAPWLLFSGIALCVIGGIRGAYLMAKHCRCPMCDKIQTPAKYFPYRKCLRCGTRLSVSWKDS